MTEPFLSRLYPNEAIFLADADGMRSFANSGDIYTGHLDPTFSSLKLDGPTPPSPKALVQMYQICKSGHLSIAEIFALLGEDLERLRIPQAQAVNFAPEHSERMHPYGFVTFLPFTRDDKPVDAKKSNLFVAAVGPGGGGLEARAHKFSGEGKFTVDQRRILVRQSQ